jgi:hypothetical protein
MTSHGANGHDSDEYPLKRLAQSLRRPLASLRALGTANDPYVVQQAFRRVPAEWFADLYTRLGIQPGSHIRRIFYLLVSQATPVMLPTGAAFENTLEGWTLLCNAARDARYLGLIPEHSIVDRRNPNPTINFASTEDEPADITIDDGLAALSSDVSWFYRGPQFSLPSLSLEGPVVSQHYQIEIWAEKSTMNDILLPLGREYGVNIVPFIGESTTTACEVLVHRARNSGGRPVRILYVSDFDPAGLSMPAAAARKIEFCARGNDDPESEIDLDIQLIPVALTPEQCAKYKLPRTPIKESESRAARFEGRFGAGATELDALEAIHPGELRRILIAHIERYFDADLANNVARASAAAEEELEQVESDVHARYADQINALDAEREVIRSEGIKALQAAWNQIADRENAFVERARPVLNAIAEELADEAPDVTDFDWPEPAEGTDHPDPLFDSARSYVDQAERYHVHQGKTPEVQYKADRTIARTCVHCGDTFTTAGLSTPKTYCSKDCELAARRSRREVRSYTIPCIVCGTVFTASRSTARVCGGTCQQRLRVRRLKEEAQQAKPDGSSSNVSEDKEDQFLTLVEQSSCRGRRRPSRRRGKRRRSAISAERRDRRAQKAARLPPLPPSPRCSAPAAE